MLEINKKNARIWSMLGMRRVLGFMLNELIKKDGRFMFVTADVARYFGTEEFQSDYPQHYVDVGIAEQNLVTVAAGLQKEGANALAATYATFITARALDQVRVSLGYMQIPVLLIGVGAGLAEGDLSATHMGLEDVALLRSVPNIRIVEPADCVELVKTLYKNIKQLCGKPLMAYSIEAAKESGLFSEVFVSTDDAVIEALEKFKEHRKEFDVICILQPTSPLRIAEDIKNAYQILVEKATVSVVSVCEPDHSPLWCNTIKSDGSIAGFLSRDLGKQRQELEKYYRLNGAI